uniref:Uncharacterized protein n=1 Tax=Oryza rufipogon TaxID=4529 RepID=A0A0E0QFU7_ORYRU
MACTSYYLPDRHEVETEKGDHGCQQNKAKDEHRHGSDASIVPSSWPPCHYRQLCLQDLEEKVQRMEGSGGLRRLNPLVPGVGVWMVQRPV